MFAAADDSGLEIAALDQRPGIYSARYGGDGLTDPERIDVVLNEMSGSANKNRSARFVASIAFAALDGKILFSCSGECPGTITMEPSGSGGFGYDPIFIPDGYSETFAELAPEIKQKISHRAKAISIFVRYLLDFTGI
jgi:XTP/dITP diphosphohydrolase